MEIYNRLPEDIQHKFFMYFSHPNAQNIRRKNYDSLLKELKEYNAFKRDVMEKIIAKSYIRFYDFVDMRSVRFSIGWYTTSVRWIYKHNNKRIVDYLQEEQSESSSSLELS